MFKSYQSKPITRLAHRITEKDVIKKVEIEEATYKIWLLDKTVKFKAYKSVNVGDYVVYLNDDDIYHCNATVFAERNEVDK